MGATLTARPTASASAAWQSMPPTMRVLYVTTRQRTGGWLAESLATDGVSDIHLEEALGTVAGLARLRDEAFDAVLVSHEPGKLDALALVEGYRAGGGDEPLVVLGAQSEQEMAALCFEAGGDGYVCVNTTTSRTLVWVVARAVQRHQVIRQNQRLSQAERQRLHREHDEAERLLVQQRALIVDSESIRQRAIDPSGMSDRRDHSPQPADASDPGARVGDMPLCGLPANLVEHYRELLRTYVIMGSGNLSRELSRLANLLATAGITARQTMLLHVHVLEELVHGLGARSTRHVMTRADLLVMEIMIHLAEGYRKRYLARARPPVQRMLPGFEDDMPAAFS